jgi:uncharacterized protein (TIGR03437 family)
VRLTTRILLTVISCLAAPAAHSQTAPSLTVSVASLNFYEQPAFPSSQFLEIDSSTGATLPFTATASSAGNWLSISPAAGTVAKLTPAVLNVSANAAGLAAGAYSGSISVSSPSAPTITIPVTLTVVLNPVFTFAPASFTFQSTSALPQPPPQSVSVFSSVPSSVFFTASTVTGGNWLSFGQPFPSTQAPMAFSVSANPTGLNPGTYTGQINLSVTQGAPSTPIPVTLVVSPPQSPTLELTPDTLTLNASPGGLAINSGLAISNAGGGTLTYTAKITAQSGGTWLSLPSTSGTVAAGTTAALPFTVTPGALTPGTYTANITVTDGSQTASSLIVFSVSPQAPPLLSQTGLVFTSIAQSALPPGQTISVVNVGSGSVAVSVQTSTLSGGADWLRASQLSTIGYPTSLPLIGISVLPQNLAPGTYYGSVNVNSQVISVQATVLPAGQTLSPSLATYGLVFTGAAYTANTFLQTQSIGINNNSSSIPALTISTDVANDWFTLQTGPNQFLFTPNFYAVPYGTHHGAVGLEFADGSIQTARIVAVAAPGNPAPFGGPFPPVSVACPSMLIPVLTSLPSGFSTRVSQSVPLTVTVVDDCGQSLANATSSSVTASFYDASKTPGSAAKVQPDVQLVPLGSGVWSSTWTPQSSVTQLEIVVSALGIPGTGMIAGQTTLNGAVQAAPASAPAVPAGIFNAASFQPGNIVAPGSLVSIFGSNLADGSFTPPTQPLPVQAQGTQVFLGGLALPLQYVGPGQINALIPANIAAGSQQSLVIQRDATQAAPMEVTVSASQPGIYTVNQQGTGQGAVLTSDYSLDAPTGSYPGAHPAGRGDFIQIFCTGLGSVTNPPAAGAAASNMPLSHTVASVTASIGGIDAPVLFAGLAPGFVGLYQVNVTVPPSAPAGGVISLTLTAGGATSNTVTIALQ